MNTKDTSYNIIKLKLLDSSWPFNIVAQLLGVSALTVGKKTFSTISIYQQAYVAFILAFFLVEIAYIVIYHEIVLATEFNIVNLTQIFNLFAESIVSCISLMNTVIFTKTSYENLSTFIRVEQIMYLLGIKDDFKYRKQGSIALLIIFYFILSGVFTIDYYFLFLDNTESTLSFHSWICLLIHIFFNAFLLLQIVFTLQMMRVNFGRLNHLMKDLNGINVLSEVYTTNATRKVNVALKERVRMIKEAHDRLYRVCAKGWTAQNIITLMEIVTSGILVTSYMYIIIGMIIDEHYNFCLLLHCCCWTLYRSTIILLLVLANDNVCTKCNYMAIIVHDILNRGEVAEVYIQLKNFSLQRLHQKLKMNACGLFTIDFTLLFEVAITITNHLVILIQFKMLGDTNKTQAMKNTPH
ncbi:gustatory receptor [Homalodisca vitripennis]|nr:gustatory receptor [Homalodisca vitripennis]